MSNMHSLSYFGHLIALALWLGGIVFFLVVVGPATQEVEPAAAARTMNRSRTALETMSWIAIALLLLTGFANLLIRAKAPGTPLGGHYMTLLSIKLVLFLAMTVHHVLQAVKYGPQIAALTAQLPELLAEWPDALLAHWRRWFLLLKLNAAIAPIAMILGLALIK